MIAALLDASVLWSAPIRDILLRAAELDLFRPLWTTQIHDEFSRTLADRRRDLSHRKIANLTTRMTTVFPDSLITSYQHLIPLMTNDPGDRHVLAAAVFGRASTVVTWNLAHFQEKDCAPHGVRVQTPDVFLSELWDAFPNEMTASIRLQAEDLKDPPMTLDQLLAALNPVLPEFVSRARLLQ